MPSIIRVIELAQESLHKSKESGDVTDHIQINIAMNQLHTAIGFLNLGYHPYQDVDELFEIFGTLDKVPCKDNLEEFLPEGSKLINHEY